MSQYAFSLSLPPVFSADNFFISDCNRIAHALVTGWPGWPSRSLLLCGPPGSGKSHLGSIWAQKSQASVTDAKNGLPAPDGIDGNRLIENIEQGKDDAALFHTLNYAKERNQYLLLTSSLPPSQLPFTLPDLTSRLKALPVASIDTPDDEVLAASMRKQFADRQLKVGEEVIAYLLPRMERSLTAVNTLVDTLDKRSLAERRELTIPFVRNLFD